MNIFVVLDGEVDDPSVVVGAYKELQDAKDTRKGWAGAKWIQQDPDTWSLTTGSFTYSTIERTPLK